MKPFARMILVSFLALAAGVEWLIIKYRNPIREFMFYDSHVSVVRTALMVIGGVIVIAAAAFAVSRRISHRKCDLDIVSDRAALRGFAIAMLLVFVFCWTLMGELGCVQCRFSPGLCRVSQWLAPWWQFVQNASGGLLSIG